jgi:hypothetical protein
VRAPTGEREQLLDPRRGEVEQRLDGAGVLAQQTLLVAAEGVQRRDADSGTRGLEGLDVGTGALLQGCEGERAALLVDRRRELVGLLPPAGVLSGAARDGARPTARIERLGLDAGEDGVEAVRRRLTVDC